MLYLLMAIVCVFSQAYASEALEPSCDKGNFALPGSQQPGPLISFGQNIIDQNQVSVSLSAAAAIGHRQYSTSIDPNFTWGVTDNFSIYVDVPFAPSNRYDSAHSSGIEDMFVQLEYAPYTAESHCTSTQLTIVANASFPTGSSHKNPPTGNGAMAFFIGMTYNYVWENWWVFTSNGAEFPLSHHSSREGNSYLYQFGLGRNIKSTKKWIFDWLLEIDGIFSEKDKADGSTDPNSGGNIIYATPSLWFSTDVWTVQFGTGYAIQQNQFGDQNRVGWLIAFSAAYTF